MSNASPEMSQGLDDNKGPGLLVVGWLEFTIATTLLMARMYTRACVRRNLGWDDWTMVIAWVLALVTTIIVTLGVHFGVGHHVPYLLRTKSMMTLVKALQMTWLTAPFSTFSAGMGKTSVALLLMRLLDPNLARSIMLWFIIVSLFIINLLTTIITFAQCTPVTFLWNRLDSTVRGRCWNPMIQERMGIFQGAYSAFTDFALALLPIFALWRLQMKLRIKVGVMIVLSLGIVAGVAAIVKTAKLPDLAAEDFTWTPVILTYWYLTENWLIIIAGCIPTLRPLLTDLLSKWRSRRINNNGALRLNENHTYDDTTGLQQKSSKASTRLDGSNLKVEGSQTEHRGRRVHASSSSQSEEYEMDFLESGDRAAAEDHLYGADRLGTSADV